MTTSVDRGSFAPPGRAASASQIAAIRAPAGPLLVLAGPGAGKTYCLTERIRFLIEQLRLRSGAHLRVHVHEQGRRRDRAPARGHARRGGGEDQARNDPRVLRRTAARARRARALEPGFGIADEEYQLSVLRRIEGPRAGTATRSRDSRRTGSAATRCCTTTRCCSSSTSAFSRRARSSTSTCW